ncbi:hypothetical protein Tco_0425270 [Tanacetum coccineum]
MQVAQVMKLTHSQSQDEEDADEESDVNDDSEEIESYKEEEKADDDEIYSDQRVYTPPEYELTNEDEENEEGNDKDMEVSKFINPYPDTCIDSILRQNIQSHTLVNVPFYVTAETSSFDTTIPPPPIPIIQPLQQTPESTTTTTIPTITLPDIPNFASLFQFDHRVSSLETEMSKFKQTNQFVEAISSILGIVDTYLASKMKEVVDVAIQL